MTTLITEGSICQCSFGLAPSAVAVAPPTCATATNLKILTASMVTPGTNIRPFGMCNSLGNPSVAAATQANMGVLTPQACAPALATPWAPAAATVTVGGDPAVTLASGCTCSYGGRITFVQSPNAVASGT